MHIDVIICRFAYFQLCPIGILFPPRLWLLISFNSKVLLLFAGTLFPKPITIFASVKLENKDPFICEFVLLSSIVSH